MKTARKALLAEALKLINDETFTIDRPSFVRQLTETSTVEDAEMWADEIFWDLFHAGIITPKKSEVNLLTGRFRLHSEHSANQARLEQALLQ